VDAKGAEDLRQLVWEAHEAAERSGYLPALGWADLADQAWRLIVEHPDQQARLAPLASDYAAHALGEAKLGSRPHVSLPGPRRRSH
jgi:hypothetical protein